MEASPRQCQPDHQSWRGQPGLECYPIACHHHHALSGKSLLLCFLLLHVLTASCLRFQVCCDYEYVHILTCCAWLYKAYFKRQKEKKLKFTLFSHHNRSLLRPQPRDSRDILAIALQLTMHARQQVRTIVCSLKAASNAHFQRTAERHVQPAQQMKANQGSSEAFGPSREIVRA